MSKPQRRRYSEKTIARRHPELYGRLVNATAAAIARSIGLVG